MNMQSSMNDLHYKNCYLHGTLNHFKISCKCGSLSFYNNKTLHDGFNLIFFWGGDQMWWMMPVYATIEYFSHKLMVISINTDYLLWNYRHHAAVIPPNSIENGHYTLWNGHLAVNFCPIFNQIAVFLETVRDRSKGSKFSNPEGLLPTK